MLSSIIKLDDTELIYNSSENFQPPKTTPSSRKITKAVKMPTGTKFENLVFVFFGSALSIITTNKNNTATAPTYTTTSNIAKNSAFNKMNKPAADKNDSINQSTECTELDEKITHTADEIVTNENTKKTKSEGLILNSKQLSKSGVRFNISSNLLFPAITIF